MNKFKIKTILFAREKIQPCFIGPCASLVPHLPYKARLLATKNWWEKATGVGPKKKNQEFKSRNFRFRFAQSLSV